MSLCSCGGDDDSGPPADVHGSYTVNVTNGPNTCNLQNWTQGDTAQDISVSITQNGEKVTATVGGVTAIFLNATLGSDTYQGTISGSDLTAKLSGTTSLSAGSCAFTIDATLHATVSGDHLDGIIEYTPNTNSSPDCAAIRTCSARQDFNGTRPPSGS